MSLSEDPARDRQLAGLRPGGAPPAPEGNQRRRTHGAYAAVAESLLEDKAREIFLALAEDAPLREAGELPAADAALVRLAATALCRLDSVSDWLTANGAITKKGPRIAVLDIERHLRREAADHLEALGMSPRARAKMGVNLARAAAMAGDGPTDLSRLTDAELELMRRLQAKARGDVIDGEVVS